MLESGRLATGIYETPLINQYWIHASLTERERLLRKVSTKSFVTSWVEGTKENERREREKKREREREIEREREGERENISRSISQISVAKVAK